MKKEMLKLEIQILTLLWFMGEIVVSSMVKFRGYHVMVIIKFLIFEGLIYSLFLKKSKFDNKKFDFEFDTL